MPEGQIDKVENARFGSSVACLGKPDANIKTTLVIIGAPYYADYGAVFVYRALEGETSLKLTQKIESPRQSLGFGMKLSDVGKEDSIGVGVGIGSPDVSTSWYVRTKPVPKFEDVSVISHTPATIDLNRFSELKVTVNPRIRFLSNYKTEVEVQARVQYDIDRLNCGNCDRQNSLTVSARGIARGTLDFTFTAKEANFGIDLNNAMGGNLRALK